MRGEEATLESLFGDRYAEYKARVPMFLPLRRPLPQRSGTFDWQGHNILGSEVPRGIRYLSYPLLFALAWQASPGDLLAHSGFLSQHLVLIAAIAAVTLTSWVWKRHFRSGARVLPHAALRRESRVGLILLIILFGGTLDAFDVFSAPWIFWVPGPILLAISVSLSRRKAPEYPYLAEASLAMAMAFLFELPWLAALLVPLYLALILDTRLPSPVRDGRAWGALPAQSYAALVCVGIVTALAVDLWMT
jgi:protein-S-isoprenylcysteine O-methyltransferase Ste14